MGVKTFSVSYDSSNYEVRASFISRLERLLADCEGVFGYEYIAELHDEHNASHVKARDWDFLPIADCFCCTSVYFDLGERHFIGYIGSRWEIVEIAQ